MNRYRVALGDKTVTVTAESMDEAIALAEQELAPMSVDDYGRSVGEGVPVIGGAANALNATTNAVLSYPFNALNKMTGREYADPAYNEIMSPDKSFSERVTGSKEAEDAKTARLHRAHPVETGVGNMTGSALGSAAMFRQAPGIFPSGKAGLFNLGKDILKGGATTGGISATDAFIRSGGDFGEAADAGLVGTITGGAGTLAVRPLETGARIAAQAIRGARNHWATDQGRAAALEFGNNVLANGGQLRPAVVDLFRKQGPEMYEAVVNAQTDPAKKAVLIPLLKAIVMGQAAMEISQGVTASGGGGF
jgi:hypothetical protein